MLKPGKYLEKTGKKPKFFSELADRKLLYDEFNDFFI